MAIVYKLVALAACLYVSAWIASHFLQRRLLYFPDPVRTPPKSIGLKDVEEREIVTPDGERIVAWWGRAKPGMPTLLYFHGNAGSLSNRAERVARYLGRGFGIFIMTYRSYGGSTGTPSESRNVADAKLAYDTLIAGGVGADDIILYGESLGSGIAVQVAAEKKVAGIILDAPYTTLVEVAELHYPRLPARTFMTDRYDTLKFLPKVTAPLLVVHGREDRVVPVAMGHKIHDMAKGPKEIAVFAGAGHSDHGSFGSNEAIYKWISRLRSGGLARGAPLAAE